MPGVVVLHLVLAFEDAREVERRAELRMLKNPSLAPTRTAAILAELGLGRQTFLVPQGTRVLTVEPARPDDVPHVIPAFVSDADVVADGTRAARRRALHEAYLEILMQDADDEAQGDDDEDEYEDDHDEPGPGTD